MPTDNAGPTLTHPNSREHRLPVQTAPTPATSLWTTHLIGPAIVLALDILLVVAALLKHPAGQPPGN